jgi:hypothetical protein
MTNIVLILFFWGIYIYITPQITHTNNQSETEQEVCKIEAILSQGFEHGSRDSDGSRVGEEGLQ